MMDLSTFDPMLKEHYAPGVVANLAFQKNKALGLMSKSQKKPGGGREWVQPVQFGLPGGGSSDFATAMAAANNASQYGDFIVPRAKHYRLGRVTNEVIEATADGDMDAFEPAFDEFDKVIQAEANYLNFRFFRSKGGNIGRMTNTNFATTVLTLDDPAGTWGVRKGDVLNLASTDGTSGAIRVGSLTVASVQRRAGTITMTGNISAGIATATANDYVFLAGDFGGAMAGLIDWLPDSDPSATTFFGLDRSQEPEMLGGCRVDGTDGRPVHELLIDMVVQVDNLGGTPDTCFANPLALGSLSKQLEGKWIVTQASTAGGAKMADIGYRGWQVTLEGHEITIYSDRTNQKSRLWMLSMDTWTMFSAGPAPNFLQKRAGSIIRVSENYDAYEARVGEYANFACKAPGWNVNGQLPT
jgi:hypothetical protein